MNEQLILTETVLTSAKVNKNIINWINRNIEGFKDAGTPYQDILDLLAAHDKWHWALMLVLKIGSVGGMTQLESLDLDGGDDVLLPPKTVVYPASLAVAGDVRLRNTRLIVAGNLYAGGSVVSARTGAEYLFVCGGLIECAGECNLHQMEYFDMCDTGVKEPRIIQHSNRLR